MKQKLLIPIFVCLLGITSASAKTAAAPSSSCSDKPVKAGPLELKIGSKTMPLPYAKIRMQQTNTIDVNKYSVYALTLADSDEFSPKTAVTVLVMNKEGDDLAQKVFRQFPVADMKMQPHPKEESPDSTTPEIQGVEVVSEADDIEYRFGFLSGVRVEFVKKDGDKISGLVRVCIKGGQGDKTFLPKPTQEIHLEGSFAAAVEK